MPTRLRNIARRLNGFRGTLHEAEGVADWLAVVIFGSILCVATGVLAWVGYVATREWQHGTDLLLRQRATEAAALVRAALDRDMKGVWTTVILPIDHRAIAENPLYNVVPQAAAAFARFPYPESLVLWKRSGTAKGLTYVLSRGDRKPPWDDSRVDALVPVLLQADPPAMFDVVEALREQNRTDAAFVMVEREIAGVPYQLVAHRLFTSTPPHTLTAIAAFTINLNWVRQQYFGPLLAQLAKINGNERSFSLSIVDEVGMSVATTGHPTTDVASAERSFPLLFLDPALVSRSAGPGAAAREWTIQVRLTRDTATLATQGARRVFALLVVAVSVSMLALLLTIRAVRAHAVVASMKSDFVAAVTHELKTPLALIRLVGDTLARGRTSMETVQEYARLLSAHALRLTQSIDNLLTYARYTGPSATSHVELRPTNVRDLIEDALESFLPRLEELGFEVTVNTPPDLPQVLADHAAMITVIESVIDNAIKYSPDRRTLSIRAHSDADYVRLTFGDSGIGIPEHDIGHVFERFYRGQNVREHGSGLGLAIAHRIVSHHRGRIKVRSIFGHGAEIEIAMRTAPHSRTDSSDHFESNSTVGGQI